MGDVCHEFFLVVLGPGNLTCHIGQGCAKIADFVFAVYLEFIVHIPGGVLFGGLGYPAKGKIDHFRKENQDDQGKQE